jgi:HAD superfamily hydrolase (TIGR01509 family)
MLEALLFDVDGTLADTEMTHLMAFNHAFAELGLDWRWDVPQYRNLLSVSGGKERIRAYWTSRPDLPRAMDGQALNQTIDRLHEVKTATYEAAVQEGEVQFRPGVIELLTAAREAGLRLAIATTTSPVNIHALLKKALGLDWTQYFSVIEDASTAPRKKPDPMVYQQTLKRLGVDASVCLAFEDSANGLKAARASGLATVITTNSFTEDHDFTGALRVLPSLQGVTLDDLRQWHAKAGR